MLKIVVGLLISVEIAHYMGPKQFGLFSFASAFVGMFFSVAGLGLQSIVVRDLVRDPDCKEETLGTAAVVQIVGGLFFYLCAFVAITWMRPEDTLSDMLVAILGFVIFFKFSEVALYWFESQVQSKYIVWIQNGCFFTFAAIRGGLIVINAPLIAFAWASAIEALFIAVLILFMLNVKGPKLRQLRFSMRRAKTLMLDSWPMLLSSAAIMVYMKIDQVMLGQLLGDEAVGIYSVAARISEVSYFIPMIIVATVFPTILEAKKLDQARYHRLLQHLYDFMAWLSFAIALPMTFLSTHIVIIIFGPAYAEAGPILAVHIWASVFVFLGVVSSQWYSAEDRQILNFKGTLLGAIFNVILNLILIQRIGAIGAAIATILSYAIPAFFYDLLQKETREIFAMKLRSLNLIASFQRIIFRLRKSS